MYNVIKNNSLVKKTTLLKAFMLLAFVVGMASPTSAYAGCGGGSHGSSQCASQRCAKRPQCGPKKNKCGKSRCFSSNSFKSKKGCQKRC